MQMWWLAEIQGYMHMQQKSMKRYLLFLIICDQACEKEASVENDSVSEMFYFSDCVKNTDHNKGNNNALSYFIV